MRSKRGALTADETRIVKALLAKGWRNQDIQALVNFGRKATVNGGRITGVKQSKHGSALRRARRGFGAGRFRAD
jgi:hypothetical protein